jgi:hypothetical protein
VLLSNNFLIHFSVGYNNKKLNRLRRLVYKQIPEEKETDTILLLDPTVLISYLDTKRAKAASEEKTVRGYSVKVNNSPISRDEVKSRREAIAKIILKSSQSFDV